MSLEHFIRGKIDDCKHAGKASERRRLDAAIEAERDARGDSASDYPEIIFDSYYDILLSNKPIDKKIE